MAAPLQLHPASFESGQPDADGLQEVVSFNHETGSHFPGMSGPKKSGRSVPHRVRVLVDYLAERIGARP
jgi:hypothetical protein